VERSLRHVKRKLRRIKIIVISVASAAVLVALTLVALVFPFYFDVVDPEQLAFRVEDVRCWETGEYVPGFSFETWTSFHRVELSRTLGDDGVYDIEIAVVLGGQRQQWELFGRLQELRQPSWRSEFVLDRELMRFSGGDCTWCRRELDFDEETLS